MYYVYRLRSITSPNQTYIGFTTNLKERIAKHNYGGSHHTSRYTPWEVVSFTSFNNIEKAKNFEQYLKTAAGRRFIKNHW